MGKLFTTLKVSIIAVALSLYSLSCFHLNLGYMALLKAMTNAHPHEAWLLLAQRCLTIQGSYRTKRDEVSSLRGMGFVYSLQGNYTEAVHFWLRAGFASDDFIIWGNCARERKRFVEAMRWYGLAIAAEPVSLDAWYYLGVTYEAEGDRLQAQQCYSRAASGRSQRVGYADVYARMGRLLAATGEMDEAKEYLKQALTVQDFSTPYNKWIALHELGAIFLREGQYGQAIALLEQAIRLYPSYAWPYLRLGLAYAKCCYDTEQAITYLNQGISLDPTNKWGYLFLGRVYQAEGELQRAEQMYRQALSLDPSWLKAQEALQALHP